MVINVKAEELRTALGSLHEFVLSSPLSQAERYELAAFHT